MDLQDLEEIEKGDPPVGESAYQEGDRCRQYQCPGILVRRFNRAEGTEFLGCSNYPECKFTY